MTPQSIVSLLDPFKLKVLEKLMGYLKTSVQVRKISPEIWKSIFLSKLDDLFDERADKKPLTADEEKLNKMRHLQNKNKLTKNKFREMLEISKKIKKGLKGDDSRLRKVIDKEMNESNALTSQRANARIITQMKAKIIYFIVTVLRTYNEERVFDVVLEMMEGFTIKTNSQYNTELIRELNKSFNTLSNETNKMTPKDFFQKKISIIYAINNISDKMGELKRQVDGFGKHIRG